jgi:hypothetical protein
MCFTGTDGLSENKLPAVFKVKNCMLQLHDTTISFAVPHMIDLFTCTLGAITTILPICKKATTLSITEKAKYPENQQA